MPLCCAERTDTATVPRLIGRQDTTDTVESSCLKPVAFPTASLILCLVSRSLGPHTEAPFVLDMGSPSC